MCGDTPILTLIPEDGDIPGVIPSSISDDGVVLRYHNAFMLDQCSFWMKCNQIDHLSNCAFLL